MKKGFITGIVLSILVAIGVLSAFGFASAHGDRDDGSDPIWSGLWSGANLTFGGTSEDDTPARQTEPTATGGRGAETPATPAPPASTNGTATPTPTYTSDYVALGDSVAAGLGLPTWDDATAQDRRCGRSPEAYAFEVGRQLGRRHALYACSGASSGDLFTRQWISNTNPNIQLNQAFANGVPEYMSITVGANDIAWRSIMQRCYTGACGSRFQTTAIEAGLILMERNLNRAMDQIRQRSGDNPPTVVLTGYYNPASAACTTFTDQRITANEVTWITANVDNLNQRLEAIADNYDFVRFAPVDFTGHDLCSNDPWVQGLRDDAPIHPTADGQQAIARAVVRAIR
jgi:lysophospholipase L1-like esterase